MLQPGKWCLIFFLTPTASFPRLAPRAPLPPGRLPTPGPLERCTFISRAPYWYKKSPVPHHWPPSRTTSHARRKTVMKEEKGASKRGCGGFGKRCAWMARQQRARCYILRRCVAMLLCWRAHALSDDREPDGDRRCWWIASERPVLTKLHQWKDVDGRFLDAGSRQPWDLTTAVLSFSFRFYFFSRCWVIKLEICMRWEIIVIMFFFYFLEMYLLFFLKKRDHSTNWFSMSILKIKNKKYTTSKSQSIPKWVHDTCLKWLISY